MASVTTPQRTHRRRERTRNVLVSAAERLVAARGIDALSIEEITAAADVAKGTFYTHFTDKEDLAAAIGLQIRLELEGKISSLNRSVKDAPQRMANGLSTVLLYAIEQPIRARALMRLIPGSVNPDTGRSFVELEYEVFEEPAPEIVGRRVEDQQGGDEERECDQQAQKARESSHQLASNRLVHQKKNPMLKWICHGGSPACRLIGKPTKRLIGPIGVE